MMASRIPVLLMAQQLTQGGSERQLTEIAKGLDRVLFDPHVAVLREGGLRVDELKAAGIPVVCFPVSSLMHPSAFSAAWKLRGYLRRQRICIAHSFDVPANIFLPPAARAAGVPVVLTSQRAFRDLTPPRYASLVRLSDRLTDGIVVNCGAIRQHLTEQEGIPPMTVRLCYNGIDTAVFHRQSCARPAELNGASVVVGVVCALRPEKDLPTLMRAFAIAQSTIPGMRLLLVGSGEMREPLGQLLRELGCSEQCVFIPSTPDVVRWLSAIDIFVLPSRSEALSNALMEAMACECAVIASDVGGSPELVALGERGLLFKPGDEHTLAAHLKTLAADPELRQRYASAGSRFIHEDFSMEKSVGRMSEIYLEMSARKS
jgi:glycosyltransferase involved in cell wall biosynthesis